MKINKFLLAFGLVITCSKLFAVTENFKLIAPSSFAKSGLIEDKYASCRLGFGDQKDKIKVVKAANLTPTFSWTSVPVGTKSLVFLLVDKSTQKPFFHWVVVDIPTTIHQLDKVNVSANSNYQWVDGKNSYNNKSYDGPCPPSSDYKFHHYQAVLYALNVETLGLAKNGDFNGQDVVEKLKEKKNNILAKSVLNFRYTTNSKLAEDFLQHEFKKVNN